MEDIIKIYADGLNLDDTIVASGKDIKVILTADELWNEILDLGEQFMEKKNPRTQKYHFYNSHPASFHRRILARPYFLQAQTDKELLLRDMWENLFSKRRVAHCRKQCLQKNLEVG